MRIFDAIEMAIGLVAVAVLLICGAVLLLAL